MKPYCKKVIVVEGKYDKIRLESCLDATILTTEGFGIFKSPEKRELLRLYGEKRGLVVLVDPDGAGKVIRSHLHTVCGKDGITDLYIPPVAGKEKRKSAPSKEGYLGVEGIDNKTLLSLFEKSGLLGEGEKKIPRYTKTDLYTLGYFGTEDSARKRKEVMARHRLPLNLSSGAFLDVVNLMEIEL
jgi:ribonuclease M5